MSFDSSYSFSAEEINLIEGSGLTIAELKDFWSRFPDQNLDTAIGGCNAEKAALGAGLVTPLVSELQDVVPEATARGEASNDAPAAEPVVEGYAEVPVEGADDSKLPEDAPAAE